MCRLKDFFPHKHSKRQGSETSFGIISPHCVLSMVCQALVCESVFMSGMELHFGSHFKLFSWLSSSCECDL